MKLIRTFSILGSLVVLSACFGTATAAKKELKSMSDQDLCENYYFSGKPTVLRGDNSWPTKREDIKHEIDYRQLVDTNDWQSIDKGRISPGMTECGLRAAWGYPLRVDHMTTAAGAT